MFHAFLVLLAAAVGVNCLMAAYEDWLNSTTWHFVVRDAVMGVAGIAAAVAGLVNA
jgi:hypothetical protein